MRDIPSTAALIDAPELASLHVLDTALSIAELALQAAHPELEEAFLNRPMATEACLADAIISHITGLETALLRYRIHLRSRGLLTTSSF